MLRRLIQTFGFAGIYLIDIETGAIVYTEGKRAGFRDASLRRSLRTHESRGSVPARTASPRSQHRRGRGFPALSAVVRCAARVHRCAGVRRRHAPSRCSCCGCLRMRINRVMTSGKQWERDGLGKTGEVYLVGPDFRMRSDSRFLIESPQQYAEQLTKNGTPPGEVAAILREQSSILYQKVRSDAAAVCAAGQRGHRRARRTIAASRCSIRGRR